MGYDPDSRVPRTAPTITAPGVNTTPSGGTVRGVPTRTPPSTAGAGGYVSPPPGTIVSWRDIKNPDGSVTRWYLDKYGNPIKTENIGAASGPGTGGPRYSAASTTGARQALQDIFIDWFGAGGYSSTVLTTAVREQWTADDVRRYACSHNAQGPAMLLALNQVRQVMARNGMTDPAASLVMSLISSGMYQSGTLEDYLPTLAGFDWTKSSNGCRST